MNLPFRLFLPSFPFPFPPQAGVLKSGSAAVHGLTHLLDVRFKVKPSLHKEQTPDVQLRQPFPQSVNDKNNWVVSKYKKSVQGNVRERKITIIWLKAVFFFSYISFYTVKRSWN